MRISLFLVWRDYGLDLLIGTGRSSRSRAVMPGILEPSPWGTHLTGICPRPLPGLGRVSSMS